MSVTQLINVLYAEDDPGTARLLQRKLQRRGYFVDIARNGAECLEMLRSGSYDILALDHDMPERTGLEVIRELAGRTSLPPTIMITGAGNETVAVEAMKLGADDYIIKDAQANYLELIPQVIEQALMRDHLRSQHRLSLEALRRKEALLAKTGELAQIGGWELDTQTKKLTWTDETYRIHEMDPGSQISLSEALDFYPPEDRAVLEDALERAVRYGETYDLELRLITRKGNLRWTRSIAAAHRENDGTLRLWGVIQDITHAKEANEQVRFQAQLLENVRESVVATDLDGRVLYWGSGAESLYGWSADEVMGRPITFIVGEDDLPDETERMRRALFEGVWSGEYEQRRKNGARFWSHTCISVVKDEAGQPMGFVGVDRDITDRTRYAEELGRRLAEISGINRLCRGITASLSVDDVVTATRKQIMEALHADEALVYLVEDDRLTLRSKSGSAFKAGRDEDDEILMGECLCGLVAKERTAVYSRDIHADDRCTLTDCKNAGVRSLAAWPLVLGAELIGVLGVASFTERDFSEHGQFLEAVAGQVAAGLQKARLYDLERRHAGDLEQAKSALEEANELLERRVEERTGELRAANEELNLAKAQWERTFDAVPDLICILDMDHCLIRVNRALAERVGLPADEMVGRGCYELLHATDRPPFFCPHSKLIEDGLEHRLELKEPRLDGVFDITVSPIPDQEGKPAGAVHIARDVTDRKEMEEALRKSERFLSDVFAGIQDAICVLDVDMNIVRANPAYEQSAPDAGKPVGKKCHEFRVNRTTPCEACPAARTLATGKADEQICPMGSDPEAPDKWLHVHTFPLFDAENGTVTGVIESIRDITDRTKAEEALRRSEERYRTLVESMNEGLVMLDRDARIVYVNRSLCSMMGYEDDELIGLKAAELFEESSRESVLREFRRRLEGDAERFEGTLARRDGSLVHVLIAPNVCADEEGRIDGGSAVFADITALKKAQAKIQASLKEKEVLLREIHHRVKNNLAVVAGLLILQGKYASDASAKAMFAEAGARVRSMAMVHEKMYASENLAQIDMREYTAGLVNHLHSVHAGLGSGITVERDVDPLLFSPESATPLAFLITELFTNCMKHAFSGSRDGTITVSFKDVGNGLLELIVKDNGRGLPEHFDLEKPTSLGTELIATFVKQLGASVTFSGVGGTEARIRFPDNRKSG